jgi:hypothetical protein
MAETLAQTTQPLEPDLQFAPSAHRNTYGYTHPSNQYGAPLPQNPYADLHIMQGAKIMDPMINWTERNRVDRRAGGSGTNRKSTGDNQGKRRGQRKPRDQDSSKPRIICQACFNPGHEAVTCWTLARALLATSFIRNVVDKEVLTKVMENYKKRFNPPEHAQANRMCANQLWAYCSDNHTTPEYVCQQMDWRGLGDSTHDSDGDDDSDSSEDGRESMEDEV